MAEYTIQVNKKGLSERQLKALVERVGKDLGLEPRSLSIARVPPPPSSRAERLSQAAEAAAEAISEYKDEVQLLLDEMQSWLDSLEDANMEHLPKYDEVQACVDALEGLLSELEDVEGSLPDGSDVNFPGMY